MSTSPIVDWHQIDNVLHRTGAVSDCTGRPGVLEVAKATYEQLLQSSHDYCESSANVMTLKFC